MYLIRMLLIGDSGVGKTSLLVRFNDGVYTSPRRSTIGVDYKAKDVEIDGKAVKLQIWDTAGQERFHSMTAAFYSRAQGVMVTFDVNDRASFDNLSHWISEIKQEAPDNCIVVLCANKTDVDEKLWKVSRSEFMAYANKLKCPCYEASAATSFNVEKMFREVGGMIVHRIQEEESFRSLLTDESSSVVSSTGDSSVSLAERTTSVSQTEYQRNNAGGCCYG